MSSPTLPSLYGYTMGITWRQAAVFATGSAIGAAVAVAIVLGARGDLPGQARPAAKASAARAVAARPSTSCPLQAATAPAGDKDGQFELMSDLSGNNAGDAQAFIVIGKEAAAAGRPRDAEVAFLMSCRVADRFKGSGSGEAAEARYQLGRHYAQVVIEGGPASPGNRNELLQRAELLYSDSLQALRALHGDSNEKARFAAEGLARVRQTLAQARTPAVAMAPRAAPSAPSAPPAPVAARAPAAVAASPAPTPPTPVARAPVAAPPAAAVPPAARPPARELETARAERPATQELGADARPRPSFDCARARSRPERLICSDAELARMDRDLGELHAWARSGSPDKADFRRRGDVEWRKRETTCRDRDCLIEWYEYRREQLLQEIDRNEAQEPRRRPPG